MIVAWTAALLLSLPLQIDARLFTTNVHHGTPSDTPTVLALRGGGRGKEDPNAPVLITPTVVSSSHSIRGYGPECATDGNEETYWLVPGGQRMEMMSRDKWLVLDAGAIRPVDALSLLGIVDSLGRARVSLEVADAPSGPWRRVGRFRALGSPLRWERFALAAPGQQPPTSRFFRLHVRREGHATFSHRVHGVTLECSPGSDEDESNK